MSDESWADVPLTMTEVAAEFFDEDALLAAPRRLYRMDGGRRRFYYEIDEETAETRFYVSVTSLIDATLPKSDHLLQWYKEKGTAADDYVDERAEYGTLFHILVGQMLIMRGLDLSKEAIEREVVEYMAAEKLSYGVAGWVSKLQSDLLAIASWARSCKVKPIAVEVSLASVELRIAGSVDLVCKMTVTETEQQVVDNPRSKFHGTMQPKKVEKEVVAIVDFKSGKGRYPSYPVQLALYRELWERTYPHVQIERLYNVSPKDWESEPSCLVTDQTDSRMAAAAPYLLALWEVTASQAPPGARKISGYVTIDGDPSELKSAVTVVTAADLVKERHLETEGDDE